MSVAQGLGWSHEAFESATLFKLLLAATNVVKARAGRLVEGESARANAGKPERAAASNTLSMAEFLKRKAAETKARGVTHG